ncbi:MAG: hypothetical protein PVH47_05590 [Thiohalocapsa sp.]|jgi:hypothetical protein
MNYTEILEQLGQASLFDLFRLNAAISNQLDDPARIAAVKRALRPGQTVRWFNRDENRLIEARLLKLNRTRAEVRSLADGRLWTIPFYLIDLDGRDVDIASRKPRSLDRNSLKVGDRVAFTDRSGEERFGRVTKLNQKSAAVQVGATRWRVGYSLLAPVIDGDVGDAVDALPGEWSQANTAGEPGPPSASARQARLFHDGGDAG